jgi:endogenous inhibitor of DNA gyrase (YacG/DUF329 family)
MVGFLDSIDTEEEEEYIPAKTFIKCMECEEALVSREYNEKNPIGACKCKNINIGIHLIENGKFTHFVTVKWEKTPPEIYEEELENDRSMEIMDTQCC